MTTATLASVVTESAMQNDLREAAERVKALYFHDADSRRNDPGFPDTWIITRAGRLLVFELKTMKGHVSKDQRDWLFGLWEAGVSAYVVRPIETDDAISLQTAIDLIAGGDVD